MEKKESAEKVMWIEEEGGNVSAWIEGVPEGLHGDKIGVIGEFKANSKEIGMKLLEEVADYFKQRHITSIVGPMNQNTWHSYRFLVDTKREKPFFLEPNQPMEYVKWFQDAGYQMHLHYYSFETELSCFTRSREEVINTYEKQGIRLENAVAFTEKEILQMDYELSTRCFEKNYYYTSIEYTEYENLYQKILHYLRKELLYYAFVGDKAIGFLLGALDYNEGEHPETILFKTFAVLPEYRKLGVATALMDCVADTAKSLGVKKGIMALVQEENHTMHMLPGQIVCSHYVLMKKEII